MFYGLTACCKIQVIPVLRLIYPEAQPETTAMIIQTVKGDLSQKLDTLPDMLRLTGDGQSAIWLEVDNTMYDYIIQVDSALYVDTITDVSYRTKGRGCSYKILDFQYKHNGELKTDNDLEIF